MSDKKNTIVESWPMLKEDLVEFLTDTDAWAIEELRKAYQDKKWNNVNKIIDIMDSIHNLSHSH
jgi:hypothetical protein